nr:protein still life, isoform SIF type 1-like isoform X2 [Dermatophagoides farinae]
MGNKISCANCNGKPSSAVAGHHHHHHPTSSSTGGGGGTSSSSATTIGITGSNVARSQQYAHHYHQVLSSSGGGGVAIVSGSGGGGGGGGGVGTASHHGAPMSNILNAGRSNHILRLWAEVFHVSASSGAVRWNQVSDDLVPVTVSFINGRYHITAFNSRVEKVLDCWLQSNKLGQASSCFIYWKDNVSGDTWGLNFTSPADARAFRECIQSGTVQLQTGSGPKRAESSYSLRAAATGTGGGNQDESSTHQSTQQQQQQQPHGRQSKAGSGAHLTTKYYSNRTAISTPNSPSKRRLQQQQVEQLQQQAYGQQQQQQPQCTCDCLTAEMLHKQRNGRIRYANFTRQDSGGTTQSSRSDGSLVRRQHERQQQYYRSAHQRSIDEHYRNRVSTTPSQQLSRTLGPAASSSHRHSRVQPMESNQQSQRIQMTGSGHQQADNYPTSIQNGGYIQIQHQKAIVHSSGKQIQQQQQDQQQSIQDQQQQQPSSRPQSQAQASQTQQLVSTATTTDDLVETTGTAPTNISQQQQQKRTSTRPKSLVSGTIGNSIDNNETRRDRTHRSLEGRRRSLERMQCVDLTDSSPTIPIRDNSNNRDLIDNDHRPSAAQLEEYERELRRRLLHGGDSTGGTGGTNNDALETFETLLKESMDDVANLMREVQHELTLIRAEEKRYQSQSTQSLHRIASAANLYGGPGSLHGAGVRSPIPQFDTMSIDGQLPFLPSFASSLAQASSAYHHHQLQQQQQQQYQSWDRLAAGYLTSSEISDDDRASLTTAISDDEDIIACSAAATGSDRYLINHHHTTHTHHQPSPKTQLNPRHQSRHHSQSSSSSTVAISFECLGSVRKSGFLSVKKWLIRKRHSLELARKRGWKGYWVCLKGTTLLFYSCDANMVNPTQNVEQQHQSTGQQQQPKSGQSSTSELTPKHLIFVDECLVQPVPEHPRRDNVFCLSTSFGDAYLFDATSLPERDQWIQVIHTACAAQIARNSGRCTISHYLVEQYQRIEQFVEQDYQQRQEAEILLTCCTDEKQKQQLINHVFMVEEKIERNRIEIFRLKSYFAALTNDEGPNPKTLLSQSSRRTKAQLNRIGVFTVSSLHAFNCAKNSQTSVEKSLHRQNSFGGSGGGGSISPVIPPSNDSAIVLHREMHYSPNHQRTTPVIIDGQPTTTTTTGNVTPLSRVQLTIILMTGEQRTMEVPQTWISEQLLSDIFGPGPESREYFLRCSETGTILYRNDLVANYSNHTLMITPKLLFTIDLVRESNEMLFGFSVESELYQNILRVFVMRVEPNSIAAMHGLCRHDEIMVINGALVQELDMMFVESILQEELTLCLMIRSARLDVPTQGQAILKVQPSNDIAGKTLQPVITQQQLLAHPGGGSGVGGGSSFDNEKTPSVTDDLIESLVCPPPPSTDFSQLILSDIQLSKYIVPKVDHFLPTSENLTSMNVIHQQQQQSSITDSTTGALLATADSYDHQGDDDRYISLANATAAITTTSPSQDNQHLQQLLQQTMISDEQIVSDIDCQQLLITDTGPPLSEAIQSALNQCHVDLTGEIGGQQQSQQQQQQLPLPPLPSISTSLSSASSQLSSNNASTSIKHMEKLIRELLDTEMNFCQSLKQLVELYLEPLSQNNFLTVTDIKVLFGSILKVIDAQNEFRSELTEVGEHILGDCELLLKKCQTFTTTSGGNNQQQEPTVNELGVGYIADCFAKHSKNFRDYSTFCASHARAVKLMAQEKTAVHEWLQKQSNGQISQSLESYLIRPIQRVLKYPLLLGQMKALCSKGTANYSKLEDAIKDLEKVAEHINEMQRIQEEYGAIFEHLARNHTRMATNTNGPAAINTLGQNGHIVDLSPPALKHSMCCISMQRNNTTTETNANSQID